MSLLTSSSVIVDTVLRNKKLISFVSFNKSVFVLLWLQME